MSIDLRQFKLYVMLLCYVLYITHENGAHDGQYFEDNFLQKAKTKNIILVLELGLGHSCPHHYKTALEVRHSPT